MYFQYSVKRGKIGRLEEELKAVKREKETRRKANKWIIINY